jgi:hypothetical protein
VASNAVREGFVPGRLRFGETSAHSGAVQDIQNVTIDYALADPWRNLSFPPAQLISRKSDLSGMSPKMNPSPAAKTAFSD